MKLFTLQTPSGRGQMYVCQSHNDQMTLGDIIPTDPETGEEYENFEGLKEMPDDSCDLCREAGYVPCPFSPCSWIGPANEISTHAANTNDWKWTVASTIKEAIEQANVVVGALRGEVLQRLHGHQTPVQAVPHIDSMTIHLTTTEAAAALGISPRRVGALINSGRLPASRFGRVWMIKARDLKKVADRKPGRPKAFAQSGRVDRGTSLMVRF